jgi:hypothetical protein
MAHDPMATLTVAELDAGSRLLKTDLVTAVAHSTQHKWQALAITAWLLAKRSDPYVKLDTFRAMHPKELSDALGYGQPDDEPTDEPVDEPAPAAEPTPPGRAAAALDERIAAAPTGPTRA